MSTLLPEYITGFGFVSDEVYKILTWLHGELLEKNDNENEHYNVSVRMVKQTILNLQCLIDQYQLGSIKITTTPDEMLLLANKFFNGDEILLTFVDNYLSTWEHNDLLPLVDFSEVDHLKLELTDDNQEYTITYYHNNEPYRYPINLPTYKVGKVKHRNILAAINGGSFDMWGESC
jgi:hypothetical protein